MDKFVLSEMRDKNFSKAVNELYLITDYNHEQYPEYYKWFYQKNIPRVISGSGEAIFYLDGFQVAGLTILKRDSEEAKICTFMVNEEYRKKGYSKLLLEESFEFLGTEKPLITIPEKRIAEFSSIISAYGWTELETIDNYFTPEIVFNRKLVRK